MSRSIVEEKIEELRKSDTSPEYYLEPIQEAIDENLSPDLIGVQLEGLGRRTMTRGVISVVDGNADGWTDIHTGWKYRSWRIWSRFDLVKLVGKMDMSVPDSLRVPLFETSLCQLMSFGLGESGFQNWCGNKLIQSFTDGNPLVDGRFWGGDPISPLAARLSALAQGKLDAFEESAHASLKKRMPAKHSIYNEIFQSWEDQNRVQSLAMEMCDFHLAKRNPFEEEPFQVLPIEAWAIDRVRSIQGLDPISRDHPLLDGPLGRPPREIERLQNDAVLANAIKFSKGKRPDPSEYPSQQEFDSIGLRI